MCLQLYVAAVREHPTFENDDVYIQAVAPTNPVHRVFSLPFVRLVGAHTGCSCGFPSTKADQPIDYAEGMFWDSENRPRDVASLTALLAIVEDHISTGSRVEAYAVWQGDEDLSPKGSITVALRAVNAERFFFIEQFLYRFVDERDSRS